MLLEIIIKIKSVFEDSLASTASISLSDIILDTVELIHHQRLQQLLHEQKTATSIFRRKRIVA